MIRRVSAPFPAALHHFVSGIPDWASGQPEQQIQPETEGRVGGHSPPCGFFKVRRQPRIAVVTAEEVKQPERHRRGFEPPQC
jgi:hypothetical protein